MYVCVLSVSSALSLKSFPPYSSKKKYPKKYQRFCPQRRQLLPLKKGTKREKKKRRRFVPLLCPAARARCSFLTAREGQKHFRAYQTGARKRRERESSFCCSDPALLFFSFFRPSFPRARKFTDNKRLQRALFFSYAAIKSAFERKIPAFFV